MVSGMRLRRKAREYALQLLFQFDLCRDAEGLFDGFWQEKILPLQLIEFTDMLVKGAIVHLAMIDRKIISNAENWSLDRMAIVDRNILRLAIYELLYLDDIPSKVTINEAIEISKRFGTEDSGAFINGILDRIVQSDERLISKAGGVKRIVGTGGGS